MENKETFEALDSSFEDENLTHEENENLKEESNISKEEQESPSDEPENVDEEQDGSKKQTILKRVKIGLIAAGCLLVVLAAVYGVGVAYYSNRFLANTTVNGVDASALTAAVVAEKLNEDITAYSLTLVLSDGSQVTILAEDISLSSNITEELIQELIDQSSAIGWVGALFGSTSHTLETAVTYDSAALAQIIEGLDCVNSTDTTSSEDAYVTYSDGSYTIVAEVYGDEIDLESLIAAATEAADTMVTKINLFEAGCYVMPEVTSEDESLISVCEAFNGYLSTSFTYVIGDDTIPIDSATIASWISMDENYEVVFDEDAMSEMISGLASTYNTCGQDKTLETQYGVTVTVPGGNYGWKVDKSGELEQLKIDLCSGETIERDLIYTYSAAVHGENDYGDSYVEINKTAQTLFLIIEGEVVLETPIVTGSEPDGNGTPCGAFAITYCTTDAILRGATYTTPVSYWMPFNGNIGMHDATWQKSFGGTRYLDGYGSHGCINMPYSAAQTVYSYVYAGFPVLMYELEGTETIDTLAKKNAAACVSLISEIGTVTKKSEAAIVAAEEAYAELTDAGKTLVTNYDVLEEARKTYDALVAASK